MEVNVPSGTVCCFCLTTYEDEALYGKFYKIEEITTHYFCLLLSSKVQQRGSDNEGILGFLPNDIRNEVRRGKKLTCTFCGKRGATLSCHHSKCKKHFHLPCGRTKDTFHEFFGEFKSFCCKHRKSQRIKTEVLKAMSDKQSTCSICLESVPATPSPSTLWAPCCSKDAWFHRLCIQRLALSAGYFFKCPLCNNTTQFIESMRTYGIWIPEQDASWERDPERYEGLLQRHNSCDAKSCRCRNGRNHHVPDTKWEIKLCAHCGSQGMHVQCGNLRLSQDWVCSVCSSVSETRDENKTGKISRSREAILSRNRARSSLPLRPPQRVTRQRRPPDVEDSEAIKQEEESKKPLSALTKSEISASKTDKGASSTPQKDASSTPAQPTEARLAGSQPLPAEENSDVEILENSDDEIQGRGATKNRPLLCKCKWSRSAQPSSPVVCSYCCDWAREYIHISKSSSATSVKTPQNLLSRFLSTLTGLPGPSLAKGEPLCQLWVIHYHSRKSNRSSRSRSSKRGSQSRSSNRASQSRCPSPTSQSRSSNRASRSRNVNRVSPSRSVNRASRSRNSNQALDPSVSKGPSTLYEKPRTRSQSRSSRCQNSVLDYSRSSQILSQDDLSVCEVSTVRQSSNCDRLNFNELKTRRHTYQNRKNPQGKRKRSISPRTSNIKRRVKTSPANKSSQISPSRNSLKKITCSQSTNSASHNKSKVTTQNAQTFPTLAMANLASFQPVVVLTRYNVCRREESVERDSHRRLVQRGGRSRREQFTLQKQLKVNELWKGGNVPCQRNCEQKRKRSVSRSFKNFQERSPIRTRSRSRSKEEDIKNKKSSHNHENVNSSNNKRKKNVQDLIVIPGGSPRLSSSDETEDEDIVEVDMVNEIKKLASEYCKLNSGPTDEIEDVVGSSDEIEDDVDEVLNDTMASISELASITYDEESCSYVITPNTSCIGSFSNASSNSDENCSLISISTSIKSSSSSSSSLISNPSLISSSSSSPQPPNTPSPQCSPSSSPPSCLTSSHVSFSVLASPSPLTPLTPCIAPQNRSVTDCEYKNQLSCPPKNFSNISSPPVRSPLPCTVDTKSTNSPLAVTNVPSVAPQNLSDTVSKPSGYKNQLSSSNNISSISSPLVHKSPLPCPVDAESTNSTSAVTTSPSEVTIVPLRRSSRRSCSPRDSVRPPTSRATRRTSGVCSEMTIRGSSPPPIFPTRSGTLTELECRIKARTLTARKFVPFSPAARQQRAMMRLLQGKR